MSSSPLFHRVVAVVVLMAVLAGCRDSPTEPEHPPPLPELHFYCLPLGVRVTCTAYLSNVPDRGQVDVTRTATWLVSDPTVGGFLEPGIFTPQRRGEVEISARYEALTARVTSWFLVDPLQPAQRLYFVAGLVRDDATNARLSGATVEILDGYARGSRSVTNEAGYYRIDRILTGETFSARASNTGYEPTTLSYRVDSPVGPGGGNSPFLDFRLRRSD
jgi:Carboxypeptidase regulatory-like domain